MIHRVKTCNYISNVLMCKEAVDAGLNFMVNITNDGFLGEGATENVAYLNNVLLFQTWFNATSEKNREILINISTKLYFQDNEIIYSSFDHTLRGTTLLRLHHISPELVDQGLIMGMREAKTTPGDLLNAKEIFMVGTTIDVLPGNVTRKIKFKIRSKCDFFFLLSVVEVAGTRVGDGQVGRVAQAARQILRRDQMDNGTLL